MLKELLQLAAAYWDDCRRYARHSFTGLSRERREFGQVQGRLMASCHVLEKGLSMPECRPRFGAAAIQALFEALIEYEQKGGRSSDPHFQSGLEVMEGYLQKHREFGVSSEDIVTPSMRSRIAAWRAGTSAQCGAVVPFTRDSFFADSDAPFAAFHASRRSCRHFDPSISLDPAVIRNAVEVALRAPSGCNRQPWKVYFITDPAVLKQCFSLHSGSRGFNHLIPALLVVSARMDVYSGPGERHQTYTDGGLFSMSLMLALHHNRIGCVPLNWGVTPELDRRMKAVVRMPDSENILMLLGIGHPAAEFTIPQSCRRGAEEVLVVVEGSPSPAPLAG